MLNNPMEIDKPRKQDECEFLFINHQNQPMDFILDINKDEINGYAKLIKMHSGIVHTESDYFGPHSIILVPDNKRLDNYRNSCFRVSYILCCIEAGQILNLNHFNQFTNPHFSKDLNVMDIVYFRLFSWNDIPQIFLISKFGETNSFKGFSSFETNTRINSELFPHQEVVSIEITPNIEDLHLTNDDDSTEKLDASIERPSAPNSKRHYTKYTDDENWKIVKYIIDNKLFDNIKGDKMWKLLESEKVCGCRTWKGMKVHFLRIVLKAYIIDNNYWSLHGEILDNFMRAYYKYKCNRNRRGIKHVLYTINEDTAIVDYIVKNHRIDDIIKHKLWTDVAKQKEFEKRSAVSLKRHFLERVLKRKILDYNYWSLPDDIVEKFRKAQPKIDYNNVFKRFVKSNDTRIMDFKKVNS